jgi:hypothetical protein
LPDHAADLALPIGMWVAVNNVKVIEGCLARNCLTLTKKLVQTLKVLGGAHVSNGK